MAKFFDMLTGGLTPYLNLVIDNDWQEESTLVTREANQNGKDLGDIPDDKSWQWRRGYECFWNGDALRCAGSDVHFSDSRILWRKGWVKGLTEQVESVGGTIKCQ